MATAWQHADATGYVSIRGLSKHLQFRGKMAHPARFELTTSAFGGQRSIQLSYGCFRPDHTLRPGAGSRAGERAEWPGRLSSPFTFIWKH